MNPSNCLEKLIADLPQDGISSLEQHRLVQWLNGLAADCKRNIAAALLVEPAESQQGLPVTVIAEMVQMEAQALETVLIDRLDDLAREEAVELHQLPEVTAFRQLIRRARLSIIAQYLEAPYNRYRTLSFRKDNQEVEVFIRVQVDFHNLTIFGDFRDRSISRYKRRAGPPQFPAGQPLHQSPHRTETGAAFRRPLPKSL
jgi:hypothetical protein